MGILDSVTKRNNNDADNTGSLYFGKPEAESENVKGQGLVDYFEDYLGILSEMMVGKFLFVGRKGTGKSAIAKYIKDKSDKSDDSFACILRMSDIAIEKIVQQDDKEHEYALIEWLILLNLTKLIVKSGSARYTNEFGKLEKFLERNTGSVDVDQKELIERLTSKNGEVNFEVLRHCFGGIINKSFQSKEQSAPYYKMITPLKEILKWLFDTEDVKRREYWILVDDLDVGYRLEDETDNDKLMDLIRIVRVYNTEVLNENSKILVFIREDICKHIVNKYNDSAKIIQSNNIPINWYLPPAEIENEDDVPLKRLADRRIKIAFEKAGKPITPNKSPWDCLIEESLSYYGSSFKYVLDHTFYRPRDIVTFLDAVRIGKYPTPLTYNNVKRALNIYTDLTINEIKSELSLYFDENEKAILFNDVFPYIVDYEISLPRLERLLEKDLGFTKSAKDTINILFEYALIGLMDERNRCYYNFREHTIPEGSDINSYSVILPKCFFNYYKDL
jgi:hypothetical protein